MVRLEERETEVLTKDLRNPLLCRRAPRLVERAEVEFCLDLVEESLAVVVPEEGYIDVRN